MKILSVIFVFVFSIAVWADDAQDFALRMGEIKSLSGDFEQTITDAKGATIQESNGQFFLLRPGYFRWETIAPFEQLLVSDLKKIWLYDPDLEQVTIRDYDQRVSQTPSVLFSGDADTIAEYYRIAKVSDARYQLTPKKTQDLFEYLWVDFVDDKLMSMTLHDSLAQVTTFYFRQTRVNTSIDLKQFQFFPPENTDVIIGN